MDKGRRRIPALLGSDLPGGVALVVVAALVMVYTHAQYDMGTLRRVGSGLFPMLVSGALLLVGLGICIKALLGLMPDLQEGGQPLAAGRVLVVATAVIAFALTFRGFGFLPAVVLAVSLGSLLFRMPIWERVMLAAAVFVVCYIVFGLLLGLNVPAFRLP